MDLMSRSLDTHVSRLRSALGLRPQNGFRLAAIDGQGYRLTTVADDNGIVPTEDDGPANGGQIG
jgi:hypothetical protein